MPKKFKKGTIGHSIERLVKRHGQGTIGLYILEAALLQATGGKSLSIDGGVSYYNTPGHKRMAAREAEILARIGNTIKEVA